MINVDRIYMRLIKTSANRIIKNSAKNEIQAKIHKTWNNQHKPQQKFTNKQNQERLE